MQPKYAIVLILVVLLVVFLLQNSDIKTIQFLFFEQRMSLSLVISVSALVGFGLGLVTPRLLRPREEHYKLNQKLETTPEQDQN